MTDYPGRKGDTVITVKYQLREIDHAHRRIGGGTGDAMRWLLRFAQSDLSALSIGDWTNLQHELSSFQEGFFIDPKDPLALFREERTHFSDKTGTSPHFGESSVTRDQVCSFQKTANRILQAIDRKQTILFEFPSLERRLCFNPNRFVVHAGGKTIERSPGWRLQSFMRDPLEWFGYSIMELLKKYANSIRRCPEFEQPTCQKLFLADRTNQNFCSVICQSRVATRRYRDDHGLRSGRSRGRPKKTSSTKEENPNKLNLKQRGRRQNDEAER